MAYRESDETLALFARNKFFTQAWLKYAQHVGDIEDVFEFILVKQIGFSYCSTHKTIADYFEKLHDYRKADKIYREGLSFLSKNDDFSTESRNLNYHYDKFAKRVSEEFTHGIKPLLSSLKMQSKGGFNQRFCSFKVTDPQRPFEE